MDLLLVSLLPLVGLLLRNLQLLEVVANDLCTEINKAIQLYLYIQKKLPKGLS